MGWGGEWWCVGSTKSFSWMLIMCLISLAWKLQKVFICVKLGQAIYLQFGRFFVFIELNWYIYSLEDFCVYIWIKLFNLECLSYHRAETQIVNVIDKRPESICVTILKTSAWLAYHFMFYFCFCCVSIRTKIQWALLPCLMFYHLSSYRDCHKNMTWPDISYNYLEHIFSSTWI